MSTAFSVWPDRTRSVHARGLAAIRVSPNSRVVEYDYCMKTITINVSEPVYRQFQELARRVDRTTSELIRESMEQYLRSRRTSGSVLDLEPLALGKMKRPLTAKDDLLGEMLK